MKVIGFLGSPRLSGICARLLDCALAGAASKGAEIKRFDLIKMDIRHCMGCCKCMFDDPSLKIGRCPLSDDMATILEEYLAADGYIMASPVYDGSVTSLMKKFLERKIALTYRPQEAYAKIGEARAPAEFKKRVAMIVTGNCSDEFREVMGDPCFEMMEAHFMIEQVMTTEKMYVGGVENMADAVREEKCAAAHAMGARLVDEIRAAQT
ncbi:MAG: flavodoxin family protein [Desulfobacterota bacterium]|nr:flavodoxin family protein [Thermodesulfobacteriota bacterium]